MYTCTRTFFIKIATFIFESRILRVLTLVHISKRKINAIIRISNFVLCFFRFYHVSIT